MNNRRLIFLHPHLMKAGGASRVVLEQASRLQQMGINLKIITTKADGEIKRGYHKIKIVELFKYSTGDLRFWILFVCFYQKLKREISLYANPILYSHSLAIYWGWICKIFDPKIIRIDYYHDLGLPFTDSGAEMSSLSIIPKIILKCFKPLFFFINRHVVSSADYLIANSESSARYIYAKYRRRSDIVINPGVDTSIFKPNGKKFNEIVIVGRLDKIKNIDTAIKAFYLFSKKNPTIRTKLIIVGTGKERKELSKLVSNLGIEKLVRFIGQISLKEIPKYYSQSKLTLALCPFESFGLSAAESISCGTPVIGINQNGISEIIQNHITGELVENSPQNIAELLDKYLVQSGNLDILSDNIKIMDRESFDWGISVTKLHKFLLSILN